MDGPRDVSIRLAGDVPRGLRRRTLLRRPPPPRRTLRPGLREPPPRPVFPQGLPPASPYRPPTVRIVSSSSSRRSSRVSSSPHAHPKAVRTSEHQSSSSPKSTSPSSHPRTVRPEGPTSAIRAPPCYPLRLCCYDARRTRSACSPSLTVASRWTQRLPGCTSSSTAGRASCSSDRQRHAWVFGGAGAIRPTREPP